MRATRAAAEQRAPHTGAHAVGRGAGRRRLEGRPGTHGHGRAVGLVEEVPGRARGGGRGVAARRRVGLAGSRDIAFASMGLDSLEGTHHCREVHIRPLKIPKFRHFLMLECVETIIKHIVFARNRCKNGSRRSILEGFVENLLQYFLTHFGQNPI